MMAEKNIGLHLVRQEALSFCENSSQAKIELLNIDEKQCRLHFKCTSKGDLSFYICLPPSTTETWNIWSMDTECSERIGTILDSFDIDSCKNITEILQHVDKCITTAKFFNHKGQDTSSASDDGDDDDEDYDDECDDYYVDEDEDAVEVTAAVASPQESTEYERLVPSANSANSMAVKRLIKDLKVVHKESSKFGITGGPKGENIFNWEMKLADFGTDSLLGRNLRDYAHRYNEEPVITLDIQFPTDFPFSPPFLRVLKPRFKFLTGHITIGGSICMEMLTKSGWRPSYDIESILVQVRSEILSDKKASLDPHRPNIPYSMSEAKTAFLRMVEKYKWN